jgi:hypothetical protein
MDAVRCLNCGATRWSYLGGTLQHLLDEPCEDCGGTVVREQRRPGAEHVTPLVERREHARSLAMAARR